MQFHLIEMRVKLGAAVRTLMMLLKSYKQGTSVVFHKIIPDNIIPEILFKSVYVFVVALLTWFYQFYFHPLDTAAGQDEFSASASIQSIFKSSYLILLLH